MAITKLNNKAVANITTLPVALGDMVFISSQTASNSASISFTTGIDSTYKEYQFYFIDIHPRTNSTQFQFNLSTDSGSNYNITKTSTAILAYHIENDTDSALVYESSKDLAQSTGFQTISAGGVGGEADESLSGFMSLFNPASTTYVKHFISTSQFLMSADYTHNSYVAGYGNTTSAVNAVRFQMSSGNFDGKILMFGIN